MTEALEENEGYATCQRDWRQLWKRQGIDDVPEDSTTTMEAEEEEDEHKDYYNDNRCVGGG